VVLVNTDPGLVSGDQDESTLDVEWSGATAPGAAVKFVVAASTATTDGVDLSAQYIVNHNTATVMSTSYGSCEQDMGATGCGSRRRRRGYQRLCRRAMRVRRAAMAARRRQHRERE
jgi:hypothetical protein